MKKFVQRQVYSFLGTKLGVFTCLSGSFITLNILIVVFARIFLEISSHSGTYASCSQIAVETVLDDHFDWSDNLAARSFEDRLLLGPIDVVYTWVNGSDPIQIQGMHVV